MGQREATGKIIEIGSRSAQLQENYSSIKPEDLLPILRRWKAGNPDKYRTIVAMICMSADITPGELKKDRRRI